MYTAEDYIAFIETGRFDKISNTGLELIAKKFREFEQDKKELDDNFNEYLKFIEKKR